MGSTVAATIEAGNGAWTLTQLSPTSRLNPARVNEPNDVIQSGRSLRDHRAAVAVADEHDGAADGADDGTDRGGVAGEAAQGVGMGDDSVARGTQLSDDAGEPGGVGERAVHEHDGGLG